MCFLYSSRLVAPIICTSPLASAGFSMLAASTLPSLAPAPTIVCSSSIKSMVCPSARSSAMALFMRSSNSPLYFVPAIMLPRSRVTILLSRRSSGIFPEVIFCASPSTIALLPTPGSPIRTGLFLVLLESICITRSISFSRPISGSSSPSLARPVRSLPY